MILRQSAPSLSLGSFPSKIIPRMILRQGHPSLAVGSSLAKTIPRMVLRRKLLVGGNGLEPLTLSV